MVTPHRQNTQLKADVAYFLEMRFAAVDDLTEKLAHVPASRSFQVPASRHLPGVTDDQVTVGVISGMRNIRGSTVGVDHRG